MAYKNKEDRLNYHREWYKKNSKRRKKQISTWQSTQKKKLADYKKTLKCSKCGYNKCPQALDFHHKYSKDFIVSKNKGLSFKKVMSEIKKCEVLCRNCHAEVHNNCF